MKCVDKQKYNFKISFLRIIKLMLLKRKKNTDLQFLIKISNLFITIQVQSLVLINLLIWIWMSLKQNIQVKQNLKKTFHIPTVRWQVLMKQIKVSLIKLLMKLIIILEECYIQAQQHKITIIIDQILQSLIGEKKMQ